MKSLKYKILTPFLILIIVLPLLTLLIFNVTMRIYENRTARAELTNTVAEMNTVVKKELFSTLFETDTTVIDNALLNIKGSIIASKFAVNTQLLLFDKDSQLIYPQNTDGTVINADFVSTVLAQKDSIDESENKIISINVDGQKYLMVGYKLTKLPISDVPYIVFTHSLNTSDGIIRFINIALLLIMLLGIIIGIFISNIISNRISKPVKHLCSTTDTIGRGEFITIEEKTKIKEFSLLYKSVNDMSGKLQAYDKAQKSFLQNASHELRTPLMSIQGYAEGIEKGIITDAQKAASIIGSESKRVNLIVDELLTISRIENQTYDREMEKLNLSDMLKEYVQRLDGLALKEGKQLTLNLPEAAVFVMADDTLLSQAINNIVSNCIRYAKSTINISLSIENDFAKITVVDDGKGISEADLPHIFERFYKGKEGNFGLGLAIAKSAVEYMRGSISARNNKEGAEFNISLPLC